MIRCPTCGFDAIYVVEATLAEPGDVLTFEPATVALEAEGFYFPLAMHQDSSTTDEVAECSACGRRGSLADFGFGDCDEQETDPEPANRETTLRLTITVTYRLTGQDLDAVAWQLRRVATLAAADGLLTGATGAEVMTWQADVAEIINAY